MSHEAKFFYEFAYQENMYLSWSLSKGRPKCLLGSRFVLSILARDKNALVTIALGAMTLALLIAHMGLPY